MIIKASLSPPSTKSHDRPIDVPPNEDRPSSRSTGGACVKSAIHQTKNKAIITPTQIPTQAEPKQVGLMNLCTPWPRLSGEESKAMGPIRPSFARGPGHD